MSKTIYELLNVRGGVIPIEPPLILREVDGLGMPGVNHIVQENAQQDGVRYIDSRLTQRVITVGIEALCECAADVWTVREQIVRLMAELANGFSLRVRLPTGATRQVDLRYQAGLTLPVVMQRNETLQPMALQAVTFDNPTLYDPDLVTLYYGLEEGIGEGFPISFPYAFMGGTIGAVGDITYPGSWQTFPIIRLGGPGTDIKIENTTTGEKIEFLDAYTLDAGEYVTIDLTPGYKTVTHSVDGNIIDQLTDDSDLGTFHIAPHPEAMGGVNTLSVDVTDASVSTWLSIEYYVRYIGI